MANQNPSDDLLLNEAKEIHEYLRHMTHLTMAWFTFFGTSNVIALGWFAIEASAENPSHTRALYIVAAFFIAQSLLGILCFIKMKQHIKDCVSRHKLIINSLYNHLQISTEIAQPPQTPALYATMLTALIAAFASFVLIWLAAAVFLL